MIWSHRPIVCYCIEFLWICAHHVFAKPPLLLHPTLTFGCHSSQAKLLRLEFWQMLNIPIVSRRSKVLWTWTGPLTLASCTGMPHVFPVRQGYRSEQSIAWLSATVGTATWLRYSHSISSDGCYLLMQISAMWITHPHLHMNCDP